MTPTRLQHCCQIHSHGTSGLNFASLQVRLFLVHGITGIIPVTRVLPNPLGCFHFPFVSCERKAWSISKAVSNIPGILSGILHWPVLLTQSKWFQWPLAPPAAWCQIYLHLYLVCLLLCLCGVSQPQKSLKVIFISYWDQSDVEEFSPIFSHFKWVVSSPVLQKCCKETSTLIFVFV